MTTLITPSGKPASCASAARCRADCGVSSDGLITTAQTGGQQRGELPHGDHQWRIPRHDGADHAHGFAHRVREGAGAEQPPVGMVRPSSWLAQPAAARRLAMALGRSIRRGSMGERPMALASMSARRSLSRSTRSASFDSSRLRLAPSSWLQAPRSSCSSAAPHGVVDVLDAAAGAAAVDLFGDRVKQVDVASARRFGGGACDEVVQLVQSCCAPWIRP